MTAIVEPTSRTAEATQYDTKNTDEVAMGSISGRNGRYSLHDQ